MCVEIYHQVGFRLYGLKLFNYANYVRFDRERLRFLKGRQWWFCLYCTYMNGTLAYMVDIAGKTEEYWCNMMHREGDGFIPQPHQKNFAPYGDKDAFFAKIDLRERNKMR